MIFSEDSLYLVEQSKVSSSGLIKHLQDHSIPGSPRATVCLKAVTSTSPLCSVLEQFTEGWKFSSFFSPPFAQGTCWQLQPLLDKVLLTQHADGSCLQEGSAVLETR